MYNPCYLTSWNRLGTDNPLENLQSTFFFKIVEGAYLKGMAVKCNNRQTDRQDIGKEGGGVGLIAITMIYY